MTTEETEGAMSPRDAHTIAVLQHVVGSLDVGSPPISDLLVSGHATRRRRRILATSVAVIVLALGGTAGVVVATKPKGRVPVASDRMSTTDSPDQPVFRIPGPDEGGPFSAGGIGGVPISDEEWAMAREDLRDRSVRLADCPKALAFIESDEVVSFHQQHGLVAPDANSYFYGDCPTVEELRARFTNLRARYERR